MVHLYRYIILIISLCTTQMVSAYGLRFRGAASPIDERTSYDVFAHSCPSFKDYFDLEFNMALYSTESVGYVLRVKGADEGQIFNLFFDFRGDDILFRLNQEGKCVLIALPVSKAEAMKSHWFKVKIAFNLKQDEITLKIHDQEKVCKGVLLSDEFSPKIVFGKSDHIIDVPEIAVDKLVVNAEHTYTFPLDEADGESVCNQEGTLYGKVENPIWLINEAYHWRKEGGFASASEAGSCYNADRNEIYYFNRDSLFVYNMETGSTSAKAFAERCPVKLFLAGSFFDSGSERLYAYEVYTENGDSEPMIASLDLHTLGWRVESYSRLSMQLHHHCSYYDAVRKRYTIFGGFGNMYYSNNYVMYDSPMDYYKNAEPRLRAYVIFPGDMFKGKEIEIYAGVYTGSTPIKPLLSDYSYGSATTKYNHLNAYKEKPKTLYLSPKSEDQQEIVTLPDGSTMTAAGENGPFYEDGGSAMTGLLARKWLNPDPAFVPREGNSAQPFILMRYAEVLLNAAEAAVELSLAGASSPDGTDMLSVATKAINDIRERAGARLLTSSLAGTIDSRDIVRKERRKELAFEHKTKWDLRRWRVNHYEGRDGFWGEQRDKDRFSNTTRYRFRGIYPFYSTETGKWFFDVCFNYTTAGDKDFGYTPLDYYFSIPGGEVSKSPVIDQQPNR